MTQTTFPSRFVLMRKEQCGRLPKATKKKILCLCTFSSLPFQFCINLRLHSHCLLLCASRRQLCEAGVVCRCHVDQIRCLNRKSVLMRGRGTVTRAPNAGRAVADTLTRICCRSKLTAPSRRASHRLRQIGHGVRSGGL